MANRTKLRKKKKSRKKHSNLKNYLNKN